MAGVPGWPEPSSPGLLPRGSLVDYRLVFLLALACIYYFGPDVDRKFLFVSPGSITAVIILVGVSLLFKLYVTNFGTFNETYGSIGVIIVLMMWLYSAGWMILLGSEMNALIEHYKESENKKKKRRSGRTRSK